MSNVLCTELVSGVHQVLGNQRTGQRRHQGIFVLIHGICSQCLRQILLSEHLTHVNDQAIERADAQGLLLDFLQAVMLLPHITHNGDNVEVFLVLQPLDAA